MLKRVPLEAGWTLWPVALVRGAGFSIDEVLRLAEPELAALARRRLADPSLEADFTEAFSAARQRQRRELRAIAADATFREAVSWQNRGAVVTGLDPLVAAPLERDDSRTRKKELLVASYLQRYAAKCETIGFFGPVGWARWNVSRPDAVSPTPGTTLTDARATFFEPWVLDALVDALGGERETAELIPLRLTGATRKSEAKLLPLFQPPRHARAAARLAKRRWPRDFPEPEQTVGAIFTLVEQGLLVPALPIALEHRPEVRLRGVSGLSSPLQERLTQAVDALTEAKAKVEEAAGGPALLPALEHLEATFTSLTGRAATRNAGQAYAGRTLVYEETRRAGMYELGESLRSTLSAPVSFLLDVARWFTSGIAQHFMKGVERSFARLGGKPVGLDTLWTETAALFDGTPPASVARQVSLLQRAFERHAPLDEALKEQRFSTAVLRRAFGRSLEPKGPAWPGARHHAPDVLVGLEHGQLMPVLGELHVGVTPFTTLSVLAHAPDRRELEQLFREDLPGPFLTPIPWEDFARSSHDVRLAHPRQRWHLDLGFRFASPLPASRVRRVADLTVAKERGRLVVRDGARRWPLLSVFERRMKLRAAGELHPFTFERHRPRVWLDGVVVAREAWRVETSSLPWAQADEAKHRFLGATALRVQLGLPRFVFVRSPVEVKPLFVDLESPTLVELLCKFARNSPSLVFTEMLPTPEQLWLSGPDGRKAVAELRLLAVDPRP
jgi:hypothetical protein